MANTIKKIRDTSILKLTKSGRIYKDFSKIFKYICFFNNPSKLLLLNEKRPPTRIGNAHKVASNRFQ